MTEFEEFLSSLKRFGVSEITIKFGTSDDVVEIKTPETPETLEKSEPPLIPEEMRLGEF